MIPHYFVVLLYRNNPQLETWIDSRILPSTLVPINPDSVKTGKARAWRDVKILMRTQDMLDNTREKELMTNIINKHSN